MIYQSLRTIRTRGYGEYQDITQVLEEEARKSGCRNGLAFVSVLHTTAAITLQEPDPNVHRDGIETFDDIVPTDRHYSHAYEGSINAAAHQKQMLIGNARIVPYQNGHLILGKWQRIFLVELFQGMSREVHITIIGE